MRNLILLDVLKFSIAKFFQHNFRTFPTISHENISLDMDFNSISANVFRLRMN